MVEARTAKLGADHPDTLTTRNNLALTYQAQKRYDLAEPLFREVVEGFPAEARPDASGHPAASTQSRSLPRGERARNPLRSRALGLADVALNLLVTMIAGLPDATPDAAVAVRGDVCQEFCANFGFPFTSSCTL